MEDILQVLQTSWPILLMVVIFYFLGNASLEALNFTFDEV